MEFVIGRIADDEGPIQLQKALTALRLHIEYREADGVNPLKHKAILEAYAGRLNDRATGSLAPVYLSDLEAEFNSQVEGAKKSTSQERKRRLANSPKRPKRVAKLVYVFERNLDVVVEVLLRARGYCEGCKKKGPFIRRSNGTVYLEVHHKQPLSEGGEDTVENAIALCPNCHRHSHFG
jgi:5-methylcytosine-specific restriction protein A